MNVARAGTVKGGGAFAYGGVIRRVVIDDGSNVSSRTRSRIDPESDAVARRREGLGVIANHRLGVQPDSEVRATETKVLVEESHPDRGVVGSQPSRRDTVNRTANGGLTHSDHAFHCIAGNRQNVATAIGKRQAAVADVDIIGIRIGMAPGAEAEPASLIAVTQSSAVVYGICRRVVERLIDEGHG